MLTVVPGILGLQWMHLTHELATLLHFVNGRRSQALQYSPMNRNMGGPPVLPWNKSRVFPMSCIGLQSWVMVRVAIRHCRSRIFGDMDLSQNTRGHPAVTPLISMKQLYDDFAKPVMPGKCILSRTITNPCQICVWCLTRSLKVTPWRAQIAKTQGARRVRLWLSSIMYHGSLSWQASHFPLGTHGLMVHPRNWIEKIQGPPCLSPLASSQSQSSQGYLVCPNLELVSVFLQEAGSILLSWMNQSKHSWSCTHSLLSVQQFG